MFLKNAWLRTAADEFSHSTTVHPWRAISLLSLAALAVATQIPHLEADPAPEKLLAPTAAAADNAKQQAVVVLLQAPDMLAPAPLVALHGLAHQLEDVDGVRRVDGVTTSPVPRRASTDAFDDADAPTLDDLEAEASDAELTDSARDLDALRRLTQAEPQRFPDGYEGLLDDLVNGNLRTDALVIGGELSLARAKQLRPVIEAATLLRGRLVSHDGTVAALAVWPDDDEIRTTASRQRFVDAIEQTVERYELPGAMSVQLSGLPYLRSVMTQRMKADRQRLIPMISAVFCLVLFAAFRWWPAVFAPMTAIGLTLVYVLGAMGLVGEKINVLSNVIPSLLMIIGISDSIHLVGRYYEELRIRGSLVEAMKTTVRRMGAACFLTSVTTAVGLASLCVSHTEMLRRFGVTAAFGVMAAYAVTILFVPGVLALFRPPRRRSYGRMSYLLEGAVVRLTAHVVRRPWRVVGAGLAVLGVAMVLAARVRIDSAVLDNFDKQDEVAKATRLVEEKLEGIRPLSVRIHSEGDTLLAPAGLASLRDARRLALSEAGVLGAHDAAELFAEMLVLLSGDARKQAALPATAESAHALRDLLGRRPGNDLATFAQADGRGLGLELRLRDLGAHATVELVQRLRERLPAVFAKRGLDVEIAFEGDAYASSQGLKSVVEDLLGSLLVAVLVIFVLLTVLFRSFRLGLLSIPPNLLPLGLTAGYMALRDIPLNAATMIIFSISLGLAVDGSIHLLSRYREELGRRSGNNAVVVRTARGTGTAVLTSGLTLVLGFALFLASSFVPVRRFGELVAVTIASCLFATMVFQPALLRLCCPRRIRRKTLPVQGAPMQEEVSSQPAPSQVGASQPLHARSAAAQSDSAEPSAPTEPTPAATTQP